MGHLTRPSPLRTFGVWLFRAGVLFLLTLRCGGVSPEAPPPSMVAMYGDSVVLPCHVEPAVDAVGMTVEWGRSDLDPRYVFVRHGGKVLVDDQNWKYKGRATMSADAMKNGDVSLRLSNLRTSDTGTYRCYIPTYKKEHFVQLLVGAVALPVVRLAGIDKPTGGVVLECECSGWYPQPEVSWMDAGGNLVSAGPPEILRGRDHLYKVNSRVTVDKGHGNTFICEVHQNRTKLTREAQIKVPDEFFLTPPSCAAGNTISVLFALMLVSLSVVFVWKWRGLKTEIQRLQKKTASEKITVRQPLMEPKNKKTMKEEAEYLEKKRAELNEEIKKNEAEQKDVETGMKTLEEQMRELAKQKKQIKRQEEEAEKKREEIEEKLKTVDKEVKEEKRDVIKAQAKAFFKLKEITQELQAMNDRKIYEEIRKPVEDLIQWITDEHKKMNDKKTELEKQREEMDKRLEEAESKLRPT